MKIWKVMFFNLMKNIKMWKAQQTPSKISAKNIIPKYIMVKVIFLIKKIERKSWNKLGEKAHTTYRGPII